MLSALTIVLGQEARADELLGDRRATAALATARGLGEEGVDGGLQVEAGVVPERVILGGRRDVQDERRDVVVLHDIAAVLPELGQLHLAGPVEDARGLPEADVLELLDVGQALVEGGDGHACRAAGCDGTCRGDAHDEHDEDEDDRHQGAGTPGGGLAGKAAGDGETRGVGTPMMVPVPVPAAGRDDTTLLWAIRHALRIVHDVRGERVTAG